MGATAIFQSPHFSPLHDLERLQSQKEAGEALVATPRPHLTHAHSP